MRVIYFTNTGKARDNNEDGIAIDELAQTASMQTSKMLEKNCKNLSVCDGMGGTKYGEVATQTFLNLITSTTITSKDELVSLIETVKEQIKEIDTGCAVAGIVLADEKFIYNVGDCRVYKKEGDFLNQLSKDHTIAQKLIDSGEIDEEEAKNHPNKHILTSAISAKTKQIELFSKDIKLFSKDIYFICSDGVWGEFELEELEECFCALEIEKIDENLQQKLQQKNLGDNLSYILLEINL